MGSMGNLKLIAVTPENYWHLKNLGKAGRQFQRCRYKNSERALQSMTSTEVYDKASGILAKAKATVNYS